MYQFDADKFATDIFHKRPEGLRRLAQRVGCTHTCIGDIERRCNLPSIPVFLALCRELELSPTDYIVADDTVLPPGAYALDMTRLRLALVGRPIPQRDSEVGGTPVSYTTDWIMRTNRYARGPLMRTWLGLCTWVEMPPGSFLVTSHA